MPRAFLVKHFLLKNSRKKLGFYFSFKTFQKIIFSKKDTKKCNLSDQQSVPGDMVRTFPMMQFYRERAVTTLNLDQLTSGFCGHAQKKPWQVLLSSSNSQSR